MIRIPIGLAGVAAVAWVLKTSRFIHEPEHVKWVIAGIVMLPFIMLAEMLVRKARGPRQKPAQRSSGGYTFTGRRD